LIKFGWLEPEKLCACGGWPAGWLAGWLSLSRCAKLGIRRILGIAI